MSRSLKEELHEFRVREKHAMLPNDKLAGVRLNAPMKARLTKLAMSHGVSEAQLGRFLLIEGLARFDIDFLKV